MKKIYDIINSNEKILLIVILSLICIYSFFSLTIFLDSFSGSRTIFIVFIACLTILVCLAKKYVLYLCDIFVAWLLFVIVLSVGSIHNPLSIFTVVVEMCIGVTLLFFCKETDWWGTFFKIIIIFSGLYAVSGISQYLCPEYGSAVVHVLLPKDGYESNLYLLGHDYYAGMATQVGYQAVFVMIGIAVAFAMLLNGNYKKSMAYYGVISFILVISFVAIVLTKKRAPLLSVLVAMTCCLMLRYRTSNKITKYKIGIIAVACILMLGISICVTDAGQNLIRRFLSGTFFQSKRFELWAEAFNLWTTKPIFGSGTNTFSLNSEFSVHNSFLQLLCENGIIGLCVFCLIIFKPLLKTVKQYNLISSSSTSYYKYQVYLMAALFIQVFCIIDSFTESIYANENLFWILVMCEAVPYSIDNALIQNKSRLNTCAE